MQTVAASVILEDAYHLMGWDAAQMEPRQEQMARSALSQALQEVWEAWWWEALMTVAQQPLRPAYAEATLYAAGEEVYFPGTQKYYQALAPTIGQPPAVDEYNSADFTVNPVWREVALAPAASGDYDDAGNYVAGDVVRFPTDGLIYQALGGLYAMGAGLADVNGAHARIGLSTRVAGGKPQYGRSDNATSLGIFWGSAGPIVNAWLIYSTSHGGLAYYSYEAVATPDLVTAWQSYGGAPLPGPTSWNTSAAPNNTFYGAIYWGAVNAFVASLATGRTVRSVSRLNPRQTANLGPYEFMDGPDGIELACIPAGAPWVGARRPTPILTGDAWDATASYTAAPEDELVYDS